MKYWEWEFHTVGDEACEACAQASTPCPCGGLIHTHFLVDLNAIKGRCDRCAAMGVPDSEEVEEE